MIGKVNVALRRPGAAFPKSGGALATFNGHFGLGLTDAEAKDLIEHFNAL